MATFTYEQRQTKITQVNQVMNILQQMQQFLNYYNQFSSTGWTVNIPGANLTKTLSATEQTAFQGQWETLTASLVKAITDVTTTMI